ncbi:PadR family transcriptional regulator [Kineosporia succinea]|uniref:DNA-binding PadR family transcriptional regulator n=1 Tax=Kineosporia succinea TaxID=84632 RepID=A0ABT9PAJ6_9ACTN|nr:PadR family transcriptional regulator [Kineosporia succinea]MDP9829706.1 DNA-binding PadR family transcriptional regulator [Kineosporia succinea]
MIELMILGFLAEGPLHGYELRRRMEQLHGYARPMSDGTIYPALKRLTAAGLLSEQIEPGTGAASRKTLHLTDAGRRRLEQILREADGHDITDGGRFILVLAFLSLLPDAAARQAVLARRLAFLEQPASFFYDGDRPLHAAEIHDPYRQGVLLTARATSTAEKAWLREQLAEAEETP